MIFKLFKSKKEKSILSNFGFDENGSVGHVAFHVMQSSEYMGYRVPDRKYLSYSASINMNKLPNKLIKEFNGWSIEDTTVGLKKYNIEADSMELLVRRVDEFVNTVNEQLELESIQLNIS